MLYRDPINININIMQQDQSQGSQSQSQSQTSHSQQSDVSLGRRYAHPRGHLHRMPYPPSYHRLLTPPNEEYGTISQSSTGSMTDSQRSMGSTSSRRSSIMSSIPSLRRQDATVGQG
ncbi:hypothetical protein QBC32DRAFT_89187 [Pseudoneurospora amorphoporcata]|uniref:Uncharacterized protein n=1 Tax=Pseudoneurospora amorphoporcata TaxID=241081 RepID=A0AAN6NYT8_9PEZI|nr:hypothetical protein QBC32DRAFT_89187 [Pseudoneurospora amorphoporcata]